MATENEQPEEKPEPQYPKPRQAVVVGIEMCEKNGVVQDHVGLVLRMLPREE